MDLTELKAKLTRIFPDKPVLRAYFFGSILHKSFNSANDIDIFLDLDQNFEFSLLDLSRLQIELSESFGKKVDLITPDSVSPLILPEIINQRVLAYER